MLAFGCRVDNTDHCLHKASDPHAWCVEELGSERPYCSPCEAEDHGCVGQEPSRKDCPAYTPPPPGEEEESTGGETHEETGEETGSTG